MYKLVYATAFLMLSACAQSNAQDPKVDTYNAQALITRAQQAGVGKPLSTEILARYSHHYTMLVNRTADGQSEFHEHFADVIVVLDGTGELVTGGTMLAPKQTAPGEQRGDGISGGRTSPLQRGDIVNIPAGIPHQVKINSKGSISYFVVKVSESGE